MIKPLMQKPPTIDTQVCENKLVVRLNGAFVNIFLALLN